MSYLQLKWNYFTNCSSFGINKNSKIPKMAIKRGHSKNDRQFKIKGKRTKQTNNGGQNTTERTK